MQQKGQERRFALWVIVLELVARNSPYNDENTSHRQSMCSDRTKRDIFQLHSSQIDMQVQECLGPVNKLLAEGFSQAGPFKHLSNCLFCSH